MNVYLYFAGVCGILCVFFGGMALGSWITERQYKQKGDKQDGEVS